MGLRFMIDVDRGCGLRRRTSCVTRLAALMKLYPTITGRPVCETIRADERHDSQRKGIRICPNALFHDSVYCDVMFRERRPVYGQLRDPRLTSRAGERGLLVDARCIDQFISDAVDAPYRP